MSDPFELIFDDKRRLVLRRPGEEDVVGVRIRRSFPWSDPSRFVSIRGTEGKEILLVEDLGALSSTLRQTIENALFDGTFIPQIKRIVDIDTRYEGQQWKVETDRGEAEFRVQEREDIRFLNDGRFHIRDADGNTYLLPRLEELDAHSRRIAEKLL